MLALGATRNFFECFWQCIPCMLKRPKMPLKKNGVGGTFFKIFWISTYLTFPTTTQGVLQHAKKWPRGWEWAHLDAKINAKPWVKTPMGRALADVLWWAFKPMHCYRPIYRTNTCVELTAIQVLYVYLTVVHGINYGASCSWNKLWGPYAGAHVASNQCLLATWEARPPRFT